MKAFFASLTYADLKLTDGKQIVAAFKKGVFETDNPKVIDFLRKCVECKEFTPEPVKPQAKVELPTDDSIEAKAKAESYLAVKAKPEPGPHATPNPHKAGA